MNKQALRHMIRVLDRVIAEQKPFSLNEWVNTLFPQGRDRVTTAFKSIENVSQLFEIPATCGTTACACGYAGLDPWFINEGFHTTEYGSVLYYDKKTQLTYMGWDGVKKFFRGDEWVAELFMQDAYPQQATPQMVRDRIQQLLDDDRS